MMAIAGVSVITLFMVTAIATAPYASATSIDAVWVEPTTQLVPMYTEGNPTEPIGYVLTNDGYSTVCRMNDSDASYTCMQLDLRR